MPSQLTWSGGKRLDRRHRQGRDGRRRGSEASGYRTWNDGAAGRARGLLSGPRGDLRSDDHGGGFKDVRGRPAGQPPPTTASASSVLRHRGGLAIGRSCALADVVNAVIAFAAGPRDCPFGEWASRRLPVRIHGGEAAESRAPSRSPAAGKKLPPTPFEPTTFARNAKTMPILSAVKAVTGE